MPKKVWYLFRCTLCRAEEVFGKKEVPYGDPRLVDRCCDHCNNRLEYLGLVGSNYEVDSVPAIVKAACKSGATTPAEIEKFIKQSISSN